MGAAQLPTSSGIGGAGILGAAGTLGFGPLRRGTMSLVDSMAARARMHRWGACGRTVGSWTPGKNHSIGAALLGDLLGRCVGM